MKRTLCAFALICAAVAQADRVTPFDDGWTFEKDGVRKAVSIPHDWVVECPVKERGDQYLAHFDGAVGTGVYRKSFTVSESGIWSICFDGVMDRSEILLNGVPLYTNWYGYTSFEVPLGRELRVGEENVVEVRASIEPSYTRFYAGAGIYRRVFLRRANAWDNPYYESAAVRPMMPPDKLKGVNLHADNGPLGMAATAESIRRQLTIMKEMGANAVRTSHNPASPLFLDIAAEMGFYVLEEAFDYWRKGKTGGGYQKVFEAHYADNLRAMVRRDRGRANVIMWSIGNEVVEQSPSYCAKHGTADAVAFGKELSEIVKNEDPFRPVTHACWNADTISNGFDRISEVYGANYLPSLYAPFIAAHPEVRIVGTETCSVLSSRGFYTFPLDARFVTEQGPYTNGFVRQQVSSYDVTTMRTNNYSPDVEFLAQERNPAVMGEFVWTGFDYLSEPSPYEVASRSSYYGIVDLCGFPKDRYYLYRSVWCPDVPTAHILPHWTWPGREGQVTPVHVYSSGDEAELFVNGVSQGIRRRDKGEYRFMWNEIVYQPGEVSVKVRKNGKEWAHDRVITAGAPAKLELEMEKNFPSYYRIRVVDGRGNFCPTAAERVRIVTTGGWKIKAVANGDAADHTPFVGTDEIVTFNGLAQVIIDKRGEGTVKVERLKKVEKEISISSDYPGGNVKVVSVDEVNGIVRVSPDYRDTNGKYFHFDFIVRGAAGRKIKFEFPKGGFDYLSSIGPAISSDLGKTWRWLNQDGRRHEPNNAFDYTFAADENETRFATSIPYVQKDWDAFVAPYRKRSDVKFGTLCKSRSGKRDVECLRLPCRGKAEWLFVLTARHHACETTGNPPMEGALAFALGDSPEAKWLRERADVVFVPFMDKDGVEDGDQGKNRKPHDHNRDYLKGRYPTVRAIKELLVRESVGKRIVFLDLHSPHVRSHSHCPEQDQVFMLGVENQEQAKHWNAFRENWKMTQKNGKLKYDGSFDIPAGVGHSKVTVEAFKKGYSGSRYWVSTLSNCYLATCAEFGYSLCGGVNSVEGMRELGSNMMKAAIRTASSCTVAD